MEIKSHLFEIMQFCLLHSILFFLYLSVLLKPNFLKKKKKKKKKEKDYLVFSCTVTFMIKFETASVKRRFPQVTWNLHCHWL